MQSVFPVCVCVLIVVCYILCIRSALLRITQKVPLQEMTRRRYVRHLNKYIIDEKIYY